MIHNTQSAKISQNQDGRNIYAIMKIMCLHGYHHNGFVATHALRHMIYSLCVIYVHHVPKCMSCDKCFAVITGRAYCYIYMIYKTNQVQMEVLVATDKKCRNEK